MNTHADKTLKNTKKNVDGNLPKQQSIGKSVSNFVDNRPAAITQRKLQETMNNGVIQKKTVVQRVLGSGYSMGPDSGADNLGAFHQDDQRRAELERIEGERRYQQQVDAARALIKGNAQLSANGNAVIAEFNELIKNPGQESPETIAYLAMNNVMGRISGSDNADREQFGGALGFSRR